MSIAGGMREDHFVKGFSFEYVYCMFAMLHMFDWPMPWRAALCIFFFVDVHWSAGDEEGDGTDSGVPGAVTSPGEPGQKFRSRTRKRHNLANKPQDFQVRPVIICTDVSSSLNADCNCFISHVIFVKDPCAGDWGTSVAWK